MDMYITAIQSAPATPAPRSGGCLGADPEAGETANNIASISRQIWDAKYRLKAYDGTPIDVTIEDSWRRVARALAAAEKNQNNGRCCSIRRSKISASCRRDASWPAPALGAA
jgi:hypothetical protein